jgi:UDP-3-O-[3-hydroxymyristoyl] glucosamine N-acyltransferase
MNGAEIARITGAELERDSNATIHRTSGLAEAGPHDAAAAVESTPPNEICATDAGAIFVSPGVDVARTDVTVLRTQDPFEALRRAARYLAGPRGEFGIHKSAVVAPDATIDPTAWVGAHCVIEAGASVGARCVLYPGSVVETGASVGPDTILGPNATIHRGTTIGTRCYIDSGAVVGSNASSVSFGDGVLERDSGIASVRIGDFVTVGANSVVERGTKASTLIGRGTQIGPLSAIAHDVVIGANCTIGGQVGISARVTIGDFVVVMGQAGLAPGSVVGAEAVIGPKTGITGTVPPGVRYLGWWGRPWTSEMRRLAATSQRRIQRLETQIEEMKVALLRVADGRNIGYD